MSKESIIVTSVGLFFVILLSVLIWKSPQLAGTAPVDDMTILVKEDSHMTGSSTAKVQVVEFGDFECPACAAVHPYLKSVLASYEGNADINFVFRNYPLPQHVNAVPSAKAAEAAALQGKYWEMFDLIYAGQDEWAGIENPLPVFEKYATTLKLNLVQFKADMASDKFDARISQDVADGNKAGVNSTPTVYVNGKKVTDLNSLKEIIDAELAK